jgi:hypothetical protein
LVGRGYVWTGANDSAAIGIYLSGILTSGSPSCIAVPFEPQLQGIHQGRFGQQLHWQGCSQIRGIHHSNEANWIEWGFFPADRDDL